MAKRPSPCARKAVRLFNAERIATKVAKRLGIHSDSAYSPPSEARLAKTAANAEPQSTQGTNANARDNTQS